MSSPGPLGLPHSTTPFAGAPNQPRLPPKEQSSVATAVDTTVRVDDEAAKRGHAIVAADSGIGGPRPADPIGQPARSMPALQKRSPLKAGRGETIQGGGLLTDKTSVAPTPIIDLSAPLDRMSAAALETRRSMLLEELQRVDTVIEGRRRMERNRYESDMRSTGRRTQSTGTTNQGSPMRTAYVDSRQFHQEYQDRYDSRRTSPTRSAVIEEVGPSYRHTNGGRPSTPVGHSSSSLIDTAATEKRRSVASNLRAAALDLMNVRSGEGATVSYSYLRSHSGSENGDRTRTDSPNPRFHSLGHFATATPTSVVADLVRSPPSRTLTSKGGTGANTPAMRELEALRIQREAAKERRIQYR